LCIAHNLEILAGTPGELFVPLNERDGESFIRTVPLLEIDQMKTVLSIIRKLARNLKSRNDDSGTCILTKV